MSQNVSSCFSITCGLFKKMDLIWKFKESYQNHTYVNYVINKHVIALVPIHFMSFLDYYFSHFDIKQTKQECF